MTQKVYVKGYGCSSNLAITGSIRSLLAIQGFEITDNVKDADYAVINTCTVKSKTEQRMLTEIKRAVLLCKTVVTGCMANAQPGLLKINFPSISIISPSLIQLIPNILVSDSNRIAIEKSGIPKLIPQVKSRRLIVPISRGCLGNCTYCIVKKALGNLHSYSCDIILDYVKSSLREGPLELYITSQDTASYGKDLTDHVNLVDLIQRILELKANFMIRIGMMNPDQAITIKENLLKLFKSEHVYKFLHVPLQSADDKILNSMGRRYDAHTFLNLVNYFRKQMPDITLVTDVIVGFPGEDNNSFKKTINFLNEIKPDKVNISRFMPRPHTVANLMPQVSDKTKSKRSKLLTDICRNLSIQRRRQFIGSINKVIILESSGSKFYGRTTCFVPIALEKNDHVKIGNMYDAYIFDISNSGYKGKILRQSTL